jgi:ATP-dependent Clp protease adaptor protein ClpS
MNKNPRASPPLLRVRQKQEKEKEEMWRVVLHNDEVHTFDYVVRSLTKVIGTLDHNAAFKVCVQTHVTGKWTITKTWKKQAEQYCRGLQRKGLSVSIAPDEQESKGVSTIPKGKTETKVEKDKEKEGMWRVVLHNDEVHTFDYVVRSLTKVIGTLDHNAAFKICVQMHVTGKWTITKTWKKQAEQYCLGLQQQGLTVSIAPDEDFG